MATTPLLPSEELVRMFPAKYIDPPTNNSGTQSAELEHPDVETQVDRHTGEAFLRLVETNEEAQELRAEMIRRLLIQKARLKTRTPSATYSYAYNKYPHVSAAPPPGCAERCKMCYESFLPEGKDYDACLDDAEAESKLGGLMADTQGKYSSIRETLEEFGNTVMRKWQKLSVADRDSLLLEAILIAYGGDSWKDSKIQDGKVFTKRLTHKKLLLPWLQDASLKEDPATLLKLMHHRTTFTPSAFGNVDAQPIDYAMQHQDTVVEYNPHVVIMQGPRYGTLVDWEPIRFHRRDMSSFPRALLTIQAQNTLSSVLETVISLMRTKSNGVWHATGRARLDELVAARGSAGSKLIVQPTFAGSPFSAPPLFDLAEIVQSLRSRHRASEDELWLLQTDAAVAHDYISRVEGSMAAAPQLSGSPELATFENVNRMMLSVKRVEQWQYVLSEAECARSTVEADRSAQQQEGKALTKKYGRALAIFEWVLELQLDNLVHTVDVLITSSGAFSRFFGWKEGNAISIKGVRTEHEKKDPIFHHLFSITRLHEDSSMPLWHHMEQLGIILERKSEKEGSRVDSMLWAVLEDISHVHGALTAIKLHYPRSQMPAGVTTPTDVVASKTDRYVDSEHSRPIDALRKSEKHESRQIRQFILRNHVYMKTVCTHRISLDEEDRPYTNLCDSMDQFKGLPTPSARIDREALARLDDLQSALRLFWENVKTWRSRQLSVMVFSNEELQNYQYHLFGKLQATCRDIWPVERSKILAEIETEEHAVATVTRRIDALRVSPDTKKMTQAQLEPMSDSCPTPKTKQKSRGVQHSDELELPNEPDTLAAREANVHTIPVGNLAKTIFDRMFKPTPEGVETRWSELVTAMTDAGFSATPGGGSAVSFRNVITQESISFHRPHPVPMLSPICLRKMGKRLTKWFGYDVETFVEKE